MPNPVNEYKFSSTPTLRFSVSSMINDLYALFHIDGIVSLWVKFQYEREGYDTVGVELLVFHKRLEDGSFLFNFVDSLDKKPIGDSVEMLSEYKFLKAIMREVANKCDIQN